MEQRNWCYRYFVASGRFSMPDRAFRHLIFLLRSGALRRCVAVACAVALLAVGFAHSVHHFGASTSTVGIQTDIGSPDNSSDPPQKAPVVLEHCHGCSMIAMTALTQPIAPVRIATEFPIQRLQGATPYPPPAETRPPILVI